MKSIGSEDFKQIVFTTDQQLHILSHFNTIDTNYKKQLINQGMKEDDIEKRLQMNGSKFLYSFAENPIRLWSKIVAALDDAKAVFPIHNNKCEIQLTFSKEEYPEGIGLDSLMAVNELNAKYQSEISMQVRGNYTVKTLERVMNPSWLANVILYIDKTNTIILSIFPGKYAPPFPDKNKQTESFFMQNKQFWDQHVMLTKKT